MKITFLGTGTSQGVPVIACDCKVCNSEDIKDKRLRSSVLIETEGRNIVIDCGPDFRYQMLRAGVDRLDAVLITHSHRDHVAGLDDVRAFNFKYNRPIDIYGREDVLKAIRQEFAYIFAETNYGYLPKLTLNCIENKQFDIGSVAVLPIEVLHYKLKIFGYRIGDFTYITDAKTIADEELAKAKGSKIVVLNALQHKEHISHLTLNQAIEVAQKIGAPQTYFTHISHWLGFHQEVEQGLPEGIHLAYDGLCLEL